MFKKKLQPLTDGDKAALVKSFLEAKGETAFEGLPAHVVDDMLLSTAQYTLINFLEFFYLYRKNSRYANNVNNFAEKLGITLHNLPLNPKLLVGLGYVFVSMRPNLQDADIEAIGDDWTRKFRDVNKEFRTETEALTSWVNVITQGVQLHELIHQTDQELDGEYAGLVFDMIADNRELVKRYLDFRGIKQATD